ncbi:hypothetical protein [Sphingomonas xanthus]|uniref:DUF485 domain-containing protein n=1 Tax=Sphingomonas xanthus TaxID=2594473 RepID=A0A516IRH4_9SPHN|nr:hypothetical protein [Sphingomonas xanthus]QDP19492.1 hypothetical protein FMM02_05655 [Sphingomonas xanthus]
MSLSSDPIGPIDDARERRRLPLIGLVLTAAYLAGLVLYLVIQGQNPADLPLNELGDFLGGVASPLAFLWLVLGYFQQGREIRLSSKALQLQAKEMRASRGAADPPSAPGDKSG